MQNQCNTWDGKINFFLRTLWRHIRKIEVVMYSFCASSQGAYVWSECLLSLVPGERAPFAHWIRELMCPRLGLNILGRRKIYGPCWKYNYEFFIVRLVDVVCVNMCSDTYTPLYPLPIVSVGRLIWLMKINLFLDVTHSTRSLKEALQGFALAAGTQLQKYNVKLFCSILQ